MNIDEEMTNLILDPWTDLADSDERSKDARPVVKLSEQEKIELENFDAQLEASSQINPELADFENRLNREKKEIQNLADNDSNNQIIADGIDKFLDLQETNRYETNNYIFERNDAEFSIKAKDERGQVFHLDSQGNIESNFNQDETDKFVEFSNQLKEITERKNQANKIDFADVEFEKAENQVIANGVENFLVMQDSERYETTNYLLQKSETGEISITALGEEQNQLFTVDSDGDIVNQLSAEETENFVNFAAKVDEVANQKIFEAVDDFLDLQGKDYHGTTNYFFDRTSDGDISITSKSSGKEVFNALADGNIVESNLSPEETKKFLEFANNVDKAVAQKENTVSQKER